MRVLLTGASGFIGSHVARSALPDAREVAALVRPGSDLRRLEGVREHLRIVEGDLLDPPSLERTVRDLSPDLCLHLAWYAAPGGRCLWAQENVDCLTGSLAFVRVLRDAGCSRLVLAGTSIEYDASRGYLTEAGPIRPANLYAAAKHALYLTAANLDPASRMSVCAARIFSVYGPWEDPRRLVAFVITRLLAGQRCDLTHGEQIRDYCHVQDVADALWAIAKSGVAGAVNVGSSRPVSVAEVARMLGAILGRSDLLRMGARSSPPDDPPFLVANTDRLRDEIGWRPRYDLESGLAQTVSWWRSRTAAPRP